MKSAIPSRFVAAVLAAGAMAVALSPSPARAFFCFGFSMEGGPSFRFGYGEPSGLRIMQFGPPGVLPQSHIVPWRAPLYSAWAPPAPYGNAIYGGMLPASFPYAYGGFPAGGFPYSGMPFSPSPWGGGFPGMMQPWPMLPMTGMRGW